MKKEELKKAILEKAELFKSRANKSLSDEKRHDLIETDERETMFSAHDKLGWSYTKIAMEFGRDPRTVNKWVKEGRIPNKHKEDKQKREQQIIQQKQIEHITLLQQLARAYREKVDHIPKSQNEQDINREYGNLLMVAFSLIHESNWCYLVGHLGDKAKKIEAIGNTCGYTWIPIKEQRQQAEIIRYTLMNSLFPIAMYGTTKEWETFGLISRCPGCHG